MQDNPPSAPEVREHLALLRTSTHFGNCSRLFTLLTFLVEECLAGRQRGLKEIVVGNAIYERNPPYDPRVDSTVRVEARRLRRRLADFYAKEGRNSPIRILLEPGSYVPVFAARDAADATGCSAPVPDASHPIFVPGPGAAIAVMPFEVLSDGRDDQSFADGLVDELIYRLQKAPGLRVASPGATFQYKGRVFLLAEAAQQLGVAAFVQGTVRCVARGVRVTIEVVDPEGFCVWAERFDAPEPSSLELQERIAAAVQSRVRFDSSSVRAARVAPGPGALQALAVVLRGRQLIDQQTLSSLRDALIQFGRGVGASDYARGHSGVADCHIDLWRLGCIDARAAGSAVADAARLALGIDAGSFEARLAASVGQGLLDGSLTAARAVLAEVHQKGSDPRAARFLAVMELIAGDVAESLRLVADARTLDPFSTHQDVIEALVLLHARRFDALLSLKADHPEVLYHQLLAIALAGETSAVHARLPALARAAARFPHLLLAEAELRALTGEADHQANRSLSGSPASNFAQATFACAAGLANEASARLATAIAAREFPALLWGTDPRFDWLAGAGFERAAPRLPAPARLGPMAA